MRLFLGNLWMLRREVSLGFLRDLDLELVGRSINLTHR
jgi:hypothetical protein